MATNLTPAYPGPSTALAPADAPALAPYQQPPAAAPAEGPPMDAQIARVKAALWRYKWLIGALAALGAVGGITASRFVEPQFVVQSAILIANEGESNRGPIQQGQVFGAQGWMDLLRTNAIADSVVMKLALYVEPEKARDSTAFRGFSFNRQTNRFIPGEYTLTVSGPRYTLRDKLGIVNEQGVVGDSIGRTAGFAWAPGRALLGGDRTIAFRVRQPREASNNILSRLGVGLNQGSNLIFLTLRGTAQQKPAETLNAWNEQFIRIATEIKSDKVSTSSRALATQRADAERALAEAERKYEQFRVNTIALPSDALAIQGGGVAGAFRNDPVMDNFTSSKIALEGLRRDRVQLEQVGRSFTADNIPVEALLAVGLVNSDPSAVTLKASLGELVQLDQQIRLQRRTLTDRNPALVALLEQRRALTAQTIPQQYRELLGQVRAREARLSGVVGQSTAELQRIPGRTTEGEALRREKDAAAGLFNTLNARFAEAQLAEKSLTPDVRVLDTAVLPSQATENTLPRLLGLGLVGGLGLGLALAVLLDRMDRRFRYPAQVTHGLGLQILGVVPEVDQTRRQTPEQVAQIVEAFRSLRMNVRYACMPNPRVALTVTSPGPNDGKSLVASNLALSFAEGGWRTVLVDGDLRRGQLNATFDLPGGPGLVEYLEGTSLLGEVVQPTAHDNLALVATGAKHRRGPELLGTPRMQQLVMALAAEYDAVIVDSPPLGAGTDAYALGAATQNIALVLRRSCTDTKMAEAKLRALDALPVQVIGAVLNEVEAGSGMYQYFAYDPDYVLVESGAEGGAARGAREQDDDAVAQLPAGG